jgi:hypothetical protein
MRFEGPPPTEALVAFYSGILRLDQQGRASASFELPDFNGTVRVMAMAWSAEGVGHAVQDLVVRDPVVISTRTRLLQDQLLLKDIPAAAAMFGYPDLKALSIKG